MLKHPTDKQRRKFAKYLARGEEIVYICGIGKRFFYSKLASSAPFALVLIGLPALFKIMRKKHSLLYIFTNHRVLVKHGIFSIELLSAPYDKITHITVSQSFFNKLFFDAGDVIINTAGPTPVKVEMEHIEKPFAIKNLLEELITQEKESLGARLVDWEIRNE